MTKIKCNMNCQHNPSGMCTLDEIEITIGEEMEANCNQWTPELQLKIERILNNHTIPEEL